MDDKFNFSQFLQTIQNLFGSYFDFFQTLRNALWEITNHQDTINEAAKHKKGVSGVPRFFSDEQFIRQNEHKRKKIKNTHLSSSALKSHADAILRWV